MEQQSNISIRDLKDIIKNSYCSLKCVSKSYATYHLVYNDELYVFDVPLDDISNSLLCQHEKSITLMRWIRKAIEKDELIKV